MSKWLLLDATTEVNTKNQESFSVLKVFGTVSKFGKSSKEAIVIRIDTPEELNKFKPMIGKEIELDIVLPHSDYSYSLAK